MNTWWKNDSVVPYVAPFFLFMAFLMAEGMHPLAVYALYPLKTVVVAWLLIGLRKRLPALWGDRLFLSTLVGVLVFLLWIGLDPWWVWRTGDLGSFQPFRFDSLILAWSLVFFRIFGASMVVPVMEELFWRGFLMRYLIREKFETVPLGAFSWLSFGLTTVLFASVHGQQWPLGVVAGLIYGAWFVRTKSLGNVMWAHGVTNLLLGLYILKTGRWYFW